MNLDELIYKRFTSSESLTKHLTTYSGLPAVFGSGTSPESNSSGWGDEQYPKIIYSYDLQANEERQSAGTLTVSLLCRNTVNVRPEIIEPEIRKCLTDVILIPENNIPYCFAWARTDAFTIEDKSSTSSLKVVVGYDMRFDILEYPNQETTDPDPIMALNRYIKRLYPESIIIGFDRMAEMTEATREQPLIYCRLITIDRAEETNTVVWLNGKFAVHIICPDTSTRIKMATAIGNHLSLDGEVIMFDTSPMFIQNIQENYKSDYLKNGQVFITGRYGLLRYPAKRHNLLNAYINISAKEE